jgi:hypothetical protein
MIKRENIRGRLALRAEDGVLRIEGKGDPSGDDIAALFSEAIASGLIAPPMPTVIELTDYTGNIDWDAIRGIAAQDGWRAGTEPPRVAYVTADANFDTVIKLVAALFPNTEHKSFASLPAALAWVKHAPHP